MKLSQQEMDWIVGAIKEYDREFGPVDRKPQTEGFKHWHKQIRFAMPVVENGNMPVDLDQLRAVETAVMWTHDNTPNPSSEFSDFVAALKVLMMDNQFDE